MGVLDKFLDIMKLSDEDDYEDDDFFDEEDDFDDYEDKKSKKSIFKKDKKYDLDEEDVYEDDDIFDTKKTSSRSFGSGKSANSTKAANNSKVTPMRQQSKKGNMEVCVIKPTSVDDTREITETLLTGSTIILNLEGMDLEVAQRIIDFTAGSTFAIDGKLQKISNFIFLVTPTNVEISGDLQDLLNSSFDVPSIKTRF